MDILYLLIPMSAVLVLLILGLFGWALHRGQFDDVEREGERILQPDGFAPDAGRVDVDQVAPPGPGQQSRQSDPEADQLQPDQPQSGQPRPADHRTAKEEAS